MFKESMCVRTKACETRQPSVNWHTQSGKLDGAIQVHGVDALPSFGVKGNRHLTMDP